MFTQSQRLRPGFVLVLVLPENEFLVFITGTNSRMCPIGQASSGLAFYKGQCILKMARADGLGGERLPPEKGDLEIYYAANEGDSGVVALYVFVGESSLVPPSHREEGFWSLFGSIGTVMVTQGAEIFLHHDASNIIIHAN